MRISKIFVTVDAVIFKKNRDGKELLLVRRKNEPFKNDWALPGGFVDEGEDLEAAAKRELLEETGVHVENAVQLKAFGKPGRDPRQHTVSIAFMAFTDENTIAKGADDAAEARWFSIDNLPQLAFDHGEIINFALTQI